MAVGLLATAIKSIIAVADKHTVKLHHVGSLYLLTYDARKLKHKKRLCLLCFSTADVTCNVTNLLLFLTVSRKCPSLGT